MKKPITFFLLAILFFCSYECEPSPDYVEWKTNENAVVRTQKFSFDDEDGFHHSLVEFTNNGSNPPDIRSNLRLSFNTAKDTLVMRVLPIYGSKDEMRLPEISITIIDRNKVSTGKNYMLGSEAMARCKIDNKYVYFDGTINLSRLELSVCDGAKFYFGFHWEAEGVFDFTLPAEMTEKGYGKRWSNGSFMITNITQ